MSDRDAFLRAIHDAPDDDAPRLVFADWLDEHGEPARAEFIRVQCTLATLDRDEPARRDLERRAASLLESHREAWLAGLPKWADRGVEFRRGFVAEVRCTAVQFLSGWKRLRKLVPLKALTLDNLAGRLDALADCPGIEGLTELDLSHAFPCTDAERATLVASPRLAGLRRLTFYNSALGPGGAAAIAASPHLASLTALRVGSCRLGREGAIALARSPHLTHLTELDVSSNDIGDAGLAALAASPLFAGLRTLLLSNSGLTAAGATTLAGCAGLAGLETLALWSNPPFLGGLASLAASPHLAGLRELNLWNVGHDPTAIHGLLRPGSFPRLTRLSLSDVPGGPADVSIWTAWGGLSRLRWLDMNGLRPGSAILRAVIDADPPLMGLSMRQGQFVSADLAALAASPLAGRLRELDLNSNAIDDAGLIALANSPYPSTLEKLSLGSNPLGSPGLRALAESPRAAGLVLLDLWRTVIDDDGVRALAASPHFASLRALYLVDCRVGDAGALALAESPHLSPLLHISLGDNQLTETGKAALRARFRSVRA